MVKNSIADLEYPALKHLAKAERRRSAVIYLTVLACVVFFFFVAYQLLQIDKHINDRVNQLTQAQQELVRKAQLDSRTRTEEFRRYITCIFILPVDQRTPEKQLFCFRKSDLPGGRQESEFVPVEITDDTSVAELSSVPPNQTHQQSGSMSQGGGVSSSSSSNNTPVAQTPQHNTSQAATTSQHTTIKSTPDSGGFTIDFPLLPAIHIGNPF